jgi:hypothetical protein
MRACAINGELDTARDDDRIRADIGDPESSVSVLLSPEQAREWARVLLCAAQQVDGECLKLSVGYSRIDVKL